MSRLKWPARSTATTLPQAPVKINAASDLFGYDMAAMNKNPYYRGTGLTNDMANESRVEPENAIAFAVRDSAWRGLSGRFGAGGSRSVGDQTILAPIMTNLIGFDGNNPDDVMEQIQPLGLTDLGTRDNGGYLTGVYIGGSRDAPWKDHKGVGVNSYVMAVALDRDEYAKINSPDPSETDGDSAVRLVMREYDPHELDYYAPHWIMGHMQRLFNIDPTKKDLGKGMWTVSLTYEGLKREASTLIYNHLLQQFKFHAFLIGKTPDVADFIKYIEETYTLLWEWHERQRAPWKGGGAVGDLRAHLAKVNEAVESMNKVIQGNAAFKLNKERLILWRNCNPISGGHAMKQAFLMGTHYCA